MPSRLTETYVMWNDAVDLGDARILDAVGLELGRRQDRGRGVDLEVLAVGAAGDPQVRVCVR